MGKVIVNKIIMLNNDSVPVPRAAHAKTNTATDSILTMDSMHMSEELVMVFDESGNCVGRVEHDQIKDLH